MTSNDGLSVGTLQEALTEITDGGGAWGRNMHPSKDVLLRVGDQVYPLAQVAVSFYGGSFTVMLTARED